MTRKQVVFIIGLNAVISAVISVIVALIFLPPGQEAPASTATAPVAGQPVATQPVEVAATPTVESVIHTVQAGDTISGLAFQYDVSEEDIIAANQLENPNFLTLGMKLLIPVGGVPTLATATFTPAPTPSDTPLPVNPPSVDMTATAAASLDATTAPGSTTSSDEIEITDILGIGQLDQERVLITNLGDGIVEMQGWTLSGAGGNVFTFPNFRLWKEGAVTVHTGVGQDGTPPSSLYWGKLQPVWSQGDEAILKDAQGSVLATFTVGP